MAIIWRLAWNLSFLTTHLIPTMNVMKKLPYYDEYYIEMFETLQDT
jgi:hypothetical protein